MLRVLFLILLVAAATRAAAQSWLHDEFDARMLDHAERRVVQAALALSGDYVGLLDGAWGKGSQAALETYTRRMFSTTQPQFVHLRPLLVAFETERRSNGWQTLYFNSTNTSYAHPFDLLDRTENGETVEYTSSDGSLALVVDFSDLGMTLGLHGAFLGKAATSSEPYQSLRVDRLITSVDMANGLLAYVRSDAITGGYVTLTLVAAPVHRTRVAVMAASMQRGFAPELSMPAGGVLDALLTEPRRAPAPDVPSDRRVAAPDPKVARPAGTGTGFYINNTDVVTADHVIEGCRQVKLSDGSTLVPLARDEDLDLAVLSAARRSDVWLTLSPEVSARLGEEVMALGYPYLSLLQPGLSVTGGNVSALGGIGPNDQRIMISAPVQPGNSGGPVLNGEGAVIGVVVSRLDDTAVLDKTGSLPQNMNFAVPPTPLTDFLDRARVMYPAAPGAVADLKRGIPDDVANAVVALFCYE